MKRVLLPLLLIACGAPPEEGPLPEADAGPVVDAGAPVADAGFDAGGPDAGVADAGGPDAGTGTVDAGTIDAGAPDGGKADAGPLPPTIYPFAVRHSPITPAVAANLQRIAGLGPARNAGAFSKIGDSNTVSTQYLSCFGGTNVDLAGRTTLQPTIDAFKAAGSYARVSQSATVGWSAGAAITGTPAPLDTELAATNARYATVMFGTNDIGDGTGDVFRFARNMFAITDRLIAKGVVPLLTTLPPRDDSTAGDARLPEFEAVVHGIAQARQVPLMELDQAMRVLPSHGLGADGLHLNVFLVNGSARGCHFTAAGLAYGHNVRNLLTIEALSRTRAAVEQGTALDPAGAAQQGSGTLADPFLIPSLPYTDVRNTAQSANRISNYPGCAAAAIDESGPEVLYKLVITQTRAVRIQVHALDTSDIDVHLMTDPASGAGCTIRNDKQIVTTLQPGTYWLSLDTYVTGGAAKSGEYLLTIR